MVGNLVRTVKSTLITGTEEIFIENQRTAASKTFFFYSLNLFLELVSHII